MSHKQVNVRWATDSDKPAIARLLHGLMVYTAGLYDKPESEIKGVETVRAELDRTFSQVRNIRYVVAEVDGEVAGICAVETSYSTWHAKPYMILNDLFVDPRFRRLKIGTALLGFVTDCARAAGCARLDLFVENANRGAIRLYEEFGFTRLKQASFSLPIDASAGGLGDRD